MIYFVEGSLASGKTTTAEDLFQQCSAQGEQTVLHYEHSRENPLDFTSRIFLPETDYRIFETQIKKSYQAHYRENYAHGMQKLGRAIDTLGDGRIIHVPTLICNDKHVNNQLQALEKYQLCNGAMPVAKYMQLLMARWKDFADTLDPSVTHIFEGALLQNPLLDLIGWYQLTDAALADFYRELLEPFELQTMCVLLITVDKWDEALKKAAHERRNSNPPWIENLINWVTHSPFGRHQHLNGFNGVTTFCKILETRERTLLEACGISHKIFERE